jgi:hypothetical protein
MRFRLIAVSSVAIALAIGVSGCTTLGTLYEAYGPKPSATPVATPSFAPTGLLVLDTGDCLDRAALEDDDRDTDPFVDCAEPHDLEVYVSYDLEGTGEYPSVETIVADATAQCASYFTPFVGLDFGISILDFVYYYPTETSWAAGDRGVNCAVLDPYGAVEGTLKGAAY